jgi:hypothetical protein
MSLVDALRRLTLIPAGLASRQCVSGKSIQVQPSPLALTGSPSATNGGRSEPLPAAPLSPAAPPPPPVPPLETPAPALPAAPPPLPATTPLPAAPVPAAPPLRPAGAEVPAAACPAVPELTALPVPAALLVPAAPVPAVPITAPGGAVLGPLFTESLLHAISSAEALDSQILFANDPDMGANITRAARDLQAPRPRNFWRFFPRERKLFRFTCAATQHKQSAEGPACDRRQSEKASAFRA